MHAWHSGAAVRYVDDDLKICKIVFLQVSSNELVLRKKEGLDRTSHDACSCSRHKPPRRWRCANNEAVDLDLDILDFMVEHIHATRQDICRQDTVAAASMGAPGLLWRQHLVAGSFLDAIFACVIYTLGWSLVFAKNL